MTDMDKNLLSSLIQERLVKNWNTCDQLMHGSEYERLSDECNRLKRFVYAFDLYLPEYIMGRL